MDSIDKAKIVSLYEDDPDFKEFIDQEFITPLSEMRFEFKEITTVTHLYGGTHILIFDSPIEKHRFSKIEQGYWNRGHFKDSKFETCYASFFGDLYLYISFRE